MATNADWTVIMDDKLIMKQTGDAAGTPYTIENDDAFWAQAKFANIWAIQYGTSVASDEVEYRDETPNGTYADANLGDISQFVTRWDSAHLTQLQKDWDENTELVEEPAGSDTWREETEAEKIARIGARPTSYSSS